MADEAQRREAPANRRNRQARERFLRAALEVWAELDATDGLTAVTPRRVARRAERHTGALYHHWPRIDLFHRDLVHWALDAERHAALDDAVGEILAPGDLTHPTDEIAGLARWSFERTVLDQRAEFRFLLAAAALADGDAEVADAVRANYQAILGRNAALYEELLSRWGRRVREPFDGNDLATVLAALSDGMALRHLVDPEAAAPELFVAAVTAVLPALSRPATSPVPLEAFVRQLLARPVDEEALRDGRARSGRAAVALYREAGWDAVTVAAVAGRPGWSRWSSSGRSAAVTGSPRRSGPACCSRRSASSGRPPSTPAAGSTRWWSTCGSSPPSPTAIARSRPPC